ncbi:hypothetical protein PSTG_05809 [Puccinia striiformis f. sp. tritici PST-78]|uniref:Uncharacterized protein n=1 Tax=Puccinia striiformis f. sp. tritici PST-78 TaxID=1165861 RepID=A0A0L0VNR5_9BASI|nr:hypothetical protein PSTG_05809 [Puccinia striiformis f. sp. tritici PST-78]
MAESTIQKKISSLSSLSIRHKSTTTLDSSYPASINEEDYYEQSSTPTTAINNTTPSTTTTTTTTTTTNTLESLLTLAHKRITTLVYLKKVHQGKVHWFNTILLSRPELEKAFEHNRMINRTTKFAILGMSLSSLLDINSLQDFLKAMTTLLSEFEAMPTDNYKPKISSLSRGIFKQSSKSARKSAGGTDYSITLQDSGDPSFIYTPNIPFDLDYFEVWITLSDILVEVYQKMIKFISTSTTTMPTNSLSTNSVSPVVTSSSTLPSTTIPAPPSTLTGQDSITLPVPPTRSSSNYSIVSVHQTYLNSSHIDLITRIDSKLKKLIVVMTKEIDHLARNAIRDELTNLDPMLLSSTYPVPSSSSSTSYAIPDPNHNSNINEWD